MTNEQIIEGNKIIFDFLGRQYCHWTFENGGSWISARKDLNTMSFKCFNDYLDLKYHKSWDWLMPVVEKIEAIDDKHHGHFGVHISSNTCSIQGTFLWKYDLNPTKSYAPVYMSDPNAIFDTKIESTWYNIVEFIKWYNNYKK